MHISQKNINEEKVCFKASSPVEDYRINMYGGEKSFLEFFCSSLHEDDIFYDVGASVGLMSLHAASLLKKGVVYSFEPDPETFSRLKENVSLNKFTNLYLNMLALSDKDGKSRLFTDGASGFAPSMRKQDGRSGAPKNSIIIETRKIDTFIENEMIPVPSVIKIDIEGAEVLFLNGAKKLLNGAFGKKPRLIFMEVHPKFLPHFESSCQEVVTNIIANGYVINWSESRENEVQYCFKLQADA